MTRFVGVLALVLVACTTGGHGAARPPGSRQPPSTAGAVGPARPEPVSARVELSARTLTAGASVSGTVVVENDTGNALHWPGCGHLFQVALGNEHVRPQIEWLDCLRDFTIPVGESRHPVTVDASYLACVVGPPQGDLANCLPDGRPPPLAPGAYQATLFQRDALVPVRPPIMVRVTR